MCSFSQFKDLQVIRKNIRFSSEVTNEIIYLLFFYHFIGKDKEEKYLQVTVEKASGTVDKHGRPCDTDFFDKPEDVLCEIYVKAYIGGEKFRTYHDCVPKPGESCTLNETIRSKEKHPTNSKVYVAMLDEDIRGIEGTDDKMDEWPVKPEQFGKMITLSHNHPKRGEKNTNSVTLRFDWVD